ncbi:MAG: hypothetical protein KKD33_02205 [Verrucomicrobia bacterium]|nr:hypothetical protein [Verrucomicrobiota bacterium]
MLPRERVLKSLKHQEPDLIPWGEHSIDYPVYEDILGRSTYVQAKFRATQAWWEGKRSEIIASYKRDSIDLVEALGMDLIIAPGMPSVEAAKALKPMDKIGSDQYRDEKGNIFCLSSVTHDLLPVQWNPDSYTPPTLDSIRADIEKIDRQGVPAPDTSCWDVVRHVVKERKATHFIATFWSDFGFPSFGQTDEDYYVNLLLHPEMLEPIAELNAKQSIGGLKYVAAQGVDAIITPGDLGSSTGPLADPKIYKRYVLPWHKKFVQEAHRLGLLVIKHCCGHVWDFVDDFVDIGYEGYEGTQASAGMDMKRLKERVGKRLTLWGGVTNENLIGGTPDQVREDARYAIKWGAPGGGFIYGASHSLAVGTKRENLMAMKEAREQWGHYPIKL